MLVASFNVLYLNLTHLHVFQDFNQHHWDSENSRSSMWKNEELVRDSWPMSDPLQVDILYSFCKTHLSNPSHLSQLSKIPNKITFSLNIINKQTTQPTKTCTQTGSLMQPDNPTINRPLHKKILILLLPLLLPLLSFNCCYWSWMTCKTKKK